MFEAEFTYTLEEIDDMKLDNIVTPAGREVIILPDHSVLSMATYNRLSEDGVFNLREYNGTYYSTCDGYQSLIPKLLVSEHTDYDWYSNFKLYNFEGII